MVHETLKFRIGTQSCGNLLSSKPSFSRIEGDFLMELRNLSGNYWRSVDLKNILFRHSMFRTESQPTSETTTKAFTYTSYHGYEFTGKKNRVPMVMWK